ncbi:MAG: histidine phosphatase family protein [Candidatus Moraniibacteriota bacterium]|nr:MAG: histidine phosphatase family protein [Candidatus Moranbacteria bacterium]
MGKTTFFLVRHGEAEHNILDVASSYPEERAYHLTEEGRRQVLARAEELARESVDVIFFSPLTRTRETAEIIAEKIGAPRMEDLRLREPGYGLFEGGSWSALVAKYPPPKRRLETDGTDGVEDSGSVRERLASFRNFVLSQYAGKRIVVVSHGNTLQLLHGILVGLTLEESVLSEKRCRFHRGEMVRVEV